MFKPVGYMIFILLTIIIIAIIIVIIISTINISSIITEMSFLRLIMSVSRLLKSHMSK